MILTIIKHGASARFMCQSSVMYNSRNTNPASGNETQKWTGGMYHCQIAVSTGVVIDTGEFEGRFLSSKARHWSEFSQRSQHPMEVQFPSYRSVMLWSGELEGDVLTPAHQRSNTLSLLLIIHIT